MFGDHSLRRSPPTALPATHQPPGRGLRPALLFGVLDHMGHPSTALSSTPIADVKTPRYLPPAWPRCPRSAWRPTDVRLQHPPGKVPSSGHMVRPGLVLPAAQECCAQTAGSTQTSGHTGALLRAPRPRQPPPPLAGPSVGSSFLHSMPTMPPSSPLAPPTPQGLVPRLRGHTHILMFSWYCRVSEGWL